jgi:hypothetical protein
MQVYVFKHSVGICAAVAMLTGCGGSQAAISALSQNALPQSAAADRLLVVTPLQRLSQTFYYTGAQQNFRVPKGVTSLTIAASAAHHGGTRGGFVEATISVTPREPLAIFVGSWSGASDVRQGGNALVNRVVVAGGAGGMGQSISCGGHVYYGAAGGDGGSLVGGRGGGDGGYGGTQSAGGQGGGNGSPGTLGMGGAGGGGIRRYGGAGGWGGDGYYGGGGGSSGKICYYGGSGGGGGSSYAEPTAQNVTMVQGGGISKGHSRMQRKNGNVVLSW